MKFLPTLILVLFCSLSLLHAEEPAQPNLLGSEVSTQAKWQNWIHPKYKEAGAVSAFKDNTVVLTAADSSKLEKQFSHGQQVIKPLELEAGKTYQFTFTTESDIAGKLDVMYILSKAPYNSYAKQVINIKAEKQKHVVVFTPKPVKEVYDTPRSLRFFCGYLANGNVTISDMVLIEAPAQ